MVRAPEALLEAERSKLLHLLNASTAQQVSAVSFRHVFRQLAHPNEDVIDAAAIFFCVANLPSDVAIPAAAANESSTGVVVADGQVDYGELGGRRWEWMWF